MPTYYHVSQRRLHLKTSLTKGTYGERIRRADFLGANYATHIKEEIFEEVRQRDFADKPSRFKCSFLFPELSIAREYYANAARYQYYVYAVEVEEAHSFVAEMDLLKCDGMSYADIAHHAQKYWSGEQHPNSGTLEVLTTGACSVQELILEPSKLW